MPDHHAKIEMVRTEEPHRRPTDRIPHPRPIYFEIPVGRENLSNTIAHVDNVTYVRWLDRVAEVAGDELGHSRKTLAGRQRMWFVARHEIDYLAETFAGDRVLAAQLVAERHPAHTRRQLRKARTVDDGPRRQRRLGDERRRSRIPCTGRR